MEPWQKDARFRWLAAGGLALAAGWAFYAQSIAPLRQREPEARRSIATLKKQIADALSSIGEVRALEAQVSRERSELHSLHRDLPSGSAVVWFPERVRKHFASLGVAGAVARLNTVLDEREPPGFERTYWAVEMPVGSSSREIRAACAAIAGIEPLDPSVWMLDVAIRPDAGDPTRSLAVINVAVLSPKAGGSR